MDPSFIIYLIDAFGVPVYKISVFVKNISRLTLYSLFLYEL